MWFGEEWERPAEKTDIVSNVDILQKLQENGSIVRTVQLRTTEKTS